MKKEKTLIKHISTASGYSLSSAGFAGFIVYLLNKYFGVGFDNLELTFIIPAITYFTNLIIVVYKKKVVPNFKEWLKN